MNKKAYIKNVIRTTLAEAYVKQANSRGKKKDSYSLGEGATDAALLGTGVTTGMYAGPLSLSKRMLNNYEKRVDQAKHLGKPLPSSPAILNKAQKFSDRIMDLEFPDMPENASRLEVFRKMREYMGNVAKVRNEVLTSGTFGRLMRKSKNRGALIGGGVVGAGVLANRLFNKD